jgi:extracellular elastinolytic metalloproteinase
MTTNPNLFSTLKGEDWQEVHSIGEVWANILYQMMWNLEDKYSYADDPFPDADIPTHGRQLAMKIVMDGMKLHPCTPTFQTARDAIVDADQALTGGANACEIWAVFAYVFLCLE